MSAEHVCSNPGGTVDIGEQISEIGDDRFVFGGMWIDSGFFILFSIKLSWTEACDVWDSVSSWLGVLANNPSNPGPHTFTSSPKYMFSIVSSLRAFNCMYCSFWLLLFIVGDGGWEKDWDTGVNGGGVEARCENARVTGVAGGGDENGGNGNIDGVGGGTLNSWLCSFLELLVML